MIVPDGSHISKTLVVVSPVSGTFFNSAGKTRRLPVPYARHQGMPHCTCIYSSPLDRTEQPDKSQRILQIAFLDARVSSRRGELMFRAVSGCFPLSRTGVWMYRAHSPIGSVLRSELLTSKNVSLLLSVSDDGRKRYGSAHYTYLEGEILEEKP